MSAAKSRSARRSVSSRSASSAARRPWWIRMVVILICLAFIGTSIAFVVASTTAATRGSGSSASDGGDSYEAAVDAARAAADEDPANPDLLTAVGDAYYNWAGAIYEDDFEDAVTYWQAAASYYTRSLAIAPDSPEVLYKKATALYYSGDTDAPAALTIFIESSRDTTALATYVTAAEEMLESLQSAASTGGAQ